MVKHRLDTPQALTLHQEPCRVAAKCRLIDSKGNFLSEDAAKAFRRDLSAEYLSINHKLLRIRAQLEGY
jgi:hypothetical protein